MRVCEVKNRFGVYQNYTFLSITVYIKGTKCHLTLIKYRQIKVYASVT